MGVAGRSGMVFKSAKIRSGGSDGFEVGMESAAAGITHLRTKEGIDNSGTTGLLRQMNSGGLLTLITIPR